MRAARVCTAPGCPTLTTGGRCQAHTRAANRARDRHHYSDAGHRHFRAAVLRRDRSCVLCHNPATVADHWPKSRRELLTLGLDPNDPRHGRGLCKPCHDRHTGHAQPGGWHAKQLAEAPDPS